MPLSPHRALAAVALLALLAAATLAWALVAGELPVSLSDALAAVFLGHG
ncbi:MAG: hypothetical protein HGA47_09425, partial [Zoogloea sp.]|nr:hypothetical protein [Zoogloea sp.]